MKRRHFLGALAAAVVAPLLPKIAQGESNHPFRGKGTATSTGPCAVCNEAATFHETIAYASGGQQIVTKVDRDTKTIDLDWRRKPTAEFSMEEMGKEYVYFNGERHVWRRIVRLV